MIADIAEADKEDVELAVKAARRAFDEGPWPRLTGYVSCCFQCKCFSRTPVLKASPPFASPSLLLANAEADLRRSVLRVWYLIFIQFVQERGRVLSKIADLIEDHGKELAALETIDSGKPFTLSQREMQVISKKLRYFAGTSSCCGCHF